jgi:hypothetical protein
MRMVLAEVCSARARGSASPAADSAVLIDQMRVVIFHAQDGGSALRAGTPLATGGRLRFGLL